MRCSLAWDDAWRQLIAPKAVLETIVETIAQALKVPYAAINLRQDGAEFATAAEYGAPKGEPLILPLVYQRETVGHLIVASRAPGEIFSPADVRLLEDLARQVEVAVHAVRLTLDLQHSRERLVTTREEERRRLRRDLHDGLGPTLGYLTLGLDTACRLFAQDPKGAEALLRELKAQTQEAISEVRRLVYGLRPPALDDLGLIPAIRQRPTTAPWSRIFSAARGRDGITTDSSSRWKPRRTYPASRGGRSCLLPHRPEAIANATPLRRRFLPR